MLVGYCSPDSLGGALKRGDAEVKIFGETFAVNARVEVMDSFSAHADYTELIQFLKCQNPQKVQKLFLVHGEYDNQLAFKARLELEGFRHIEIPDQFASFDV